LIRTGSLSRNWEYGVWVGLSRNSLPSSLFLRLLLTREGQYPSIYVRPTHPASALPGYGLLCLSILHMIPTSSRTSICIYVPSYPEVNIHLLHSFGPYRRGRCSPYARVVQGLGALRSFLILGSTISSPFIPGSTCMEVWNCRARAWRSESYNNRNGFVRATVPVVCQSKEFLIYGATFPACCSEMPSSLTRYWIL